MEPKETYNAYKKEIGKDVLKTLAFFFVGLPLLVAAIVALLMF